MKDVTAKSYSQKKTFTFGTNLKEKKTTSGSQEMRTKTLNHHLGGTQTDQDESRKKLKASLKNHNKTSPNT